MPVFAEFEELTAAQTGDQLAFGRLTRPYQNELTLHGYRMLGSLQDAEDLLQETLLKAWRRLETYQPHGSFRAWLYKIATNLCLDLLRSRPRRTLPHLFEAASDPLGPVSPPPSDPVWLDPLPSPWWDTNPENQALVRESVSLAFLTALQSLSPRQRAVLILRDVLDWSAKETAELLETSVAAVNSSLHRARTVAKVSNKNAVPSPRHEKLLERYLRVWESRDVTGLVALLKEDAVFAMPPTPTWYQGKAAVTSFLRQHVFSGEPWRLVPTEANGQPAFAVYQSTPEGWKPYLLQVLTVTGTGEIAAVTSFLYPELFVRFGLPAAIGS